MKRERLPRTLRRPVDRLDRLQRATAGFALRPLQTPVERLRRATASIVIRLLAFNVLLVFLPAAGFLYLDTYEEQLLVAQERSMVQQGRLLAAALAGRGELAEEDAERVLAELGQRTTARLRVFDRQGRLLADSSQMGPRREPDEAASAEAESSPTARTNWLYKLGAAAFKLLDRSFSRLLGRSQLTEPGRIYAPAPAPEDAGVRTALAGRYGAAVRKSPGQRSVTLYSAIPVASRGEVVGAVQVSQSTLRLLTDLYEVRLAIFRAFLASVAVAVVLSLLVSGTIARPLRRLRWEASELLDRRGRLRGRFTGSRRLDEIGDLARALAELSRRLGEHLAFIETFAADVSHEFKNPLASIHTATEMLAESESPADRERFRAMVEADVARLQKLLSNVREITQIDAQIDAEERQPVVLGRLLGELVEGLRLREGADRGDHGAERGPDREAEPGGGRAAERGEDRGAGRPVRFDVEGLGEPVAVLASPDRLAQAFQNVLDNARSFAPEGSMIMVSLAREGEDAVVTIADQGPGIPPEHLGRIFDRFFSYRPNDPEARRDHAGLGLAIVRAIVEAYGGVVTAANGPGGGAVFRVRLPAV